MQLGTSCLRASALHLQYCSDLRKLSSLTQNQDEDRKSSRNVSTRGSSKDYILTKELWHSAERVVCSHKLRAPNIKK